MDTQTTINLIEKIAEVISINSTTMQAANMAFYAACASGGISLIGVIISGIIVFKSKRIDYKNSYHIMIFRKKMIAYELIEQLIFKSSCAIYSDIDIKKEIAECIVLLLKIQSYSLWISNSANKLLIQLNCILYKLNMENGSNDEKLLNDFLNMKMKIEKQVSYDMKHDIITNTATSIMPMFSSVTSDGFGGSTDGKTAK